MSKQTINLGTAPTGVGGDTPRSAFTKAMSNFDELYAALGGGGSPVALPAALPIANGGTGNSTGTATKLAAAAMVGTVSQSAGVPTGALMEAGSNANGVFEKYACGTLICRDLQTVNVAVPAGTHVIPMFRLPITPVGEYFSTTELQFFTLFDGAGGTIYSSRQGYARAAVFINTGLNSSTSLPSFTALGSTTANSYVFRTLVVGRWF